MYFFYSLLLITWGLALLPIFLYRAWRHGKRLPGMRQRFGHLPEHLRADGRTVIWFHSCSVGETLSLEPLVRILRERLPDARFLFSTVTPTGQEIAVKNFGAENVFYFPVDLAFVVRRVLDWIKPSLIVIIDTEIWPNLLHQARRLHVPIAMANGRISSDSFRYYRLARPVLRRVLRNYTALMMQSREDAQRIAAIGAPREKISTPGNMKFDRDLFRRDSNEALQRDLAENFGLVADTPLIVAGSTHPGEESILLEVLRELRQTAGLEKTRLLLAPRHPERFDKAAAETEVAGFMVRRRTRKSDAAAPVLLLDTLGELMEVYRFADVVFVGGTLVNRGGHSILEPAAFAKAIVVGTSMENFRAVRNEFVACGAIRQIKATEQDRHAQTEQLLDVFRELLQNGEARESLGKAALAVLEKNQGAAQRIANWIIDAINR